MMSLRRLVPVARTLATLALGGAGGVVAAWLGLPLPWLIGSLLVVAAAAIAEIRVAGHGVQVPPVLRTITVPIVGVMLGGTFTPEVVRQIPHWWPTVLGLVGFALAATFVVYQIYRRGFGFDPATAYFAAVPGGFVEMTLVGETCGGDPRRISIVQFTRVVLAVLLIPFVMRAIYGPVGSAVIGQAPHGDLTPADLVLLTAAGLAGFYAARALRLPGGIVTGPMIVSAVIHAAGLTDATPPAWLVFAAQLVIGAALGARFTGISLSLLRRMMVAATIGTVTATLLGVLTAVALVTFVPEPVTALVLAYAPGGLAEMTLIALSLRIGVAFVAAHHMVRLAIATLLMPAIWRRFLARRLVPPDTTG